MYIGDTRTEHQALVIKLPFLVVNVLWLFLTVLQCVIVVFSDHTHLLYAANMEISHSRTS